MVAVSLSDSPPDCEAWARLLRSRHARTESALRDFCLKVNQNLLGAAKENRMLKLRVITTDEKFVEDLNSAGIEGVRASYRPTMAYDSAEHIFEIVVTAGTGAILKLVGEWTINRFKRNPPKEITINNQTIINAETIQTVINICINADNDKEKDKSAKD
jgi:hypothetical protein